MSSIRLPLTLLVLLALQLSVWQWGLSYEHLLTLSGYLSINFMSLTMLLAMRPRWLEYPLGGLDKMYQLHKWTGILGALFAIAHWLIEETDDAVKSLFGKERSLREADFSGLLDNLQDSFKDLGEQGFYLLFGCLVCEVSKNDLHDVTNSPTREFLPAPVIFTGTIWPTKSSEPLKCVPCR